MTISYDEYIKTKKKKSTEQLIDEYLSMKKPTTTQTTTKKKKDDDEKWYQGWFEGGAFDDGFDLMDIPQTITGTLQDANQDFFRGVSNIGEGLIDTGAYAVGGIANILGKDKFAEDTKKFIARDLIDELGVVEYGTQNSLLGVTNNILHGNTDVYSAKTSKQTFTNMYETLFGDHENVEKTALQKDEVSEESSLLGHKTDGLVQSAGQLVGTMGLQAVGVPWFLTSGVTSFGGGVEEAFQEDATYTQAGISGGVTALAEILTEKISGGISFGGKTLDTGIKNFLTKKITSQVGKNLAKFGIDAVGEGVEEVLSEAISNVGKLSYQDKTLQEALFSEEAFDQYIESFIGGAVLGGGFNVGKVSKSIKTGRDYDTGLTANEQKVVDKEIDSRTTEIKKQKAVEDRIKQVIAEREGTFGTLSDAEKKNITKKVQEQLANGEIDYTNSKVSNKELKNIEEQVRKDLERGEISVDAIESTLMGEKTAQIKELEAQLGKTTKAEKKAQIQAQINELQTAKATELQEMLKKDGMLQASYREANLRSQKFEYEAKETDSEYRKALAEDFKRVANNSTKSHETFEMISKIAEDKQTAYGVINNEQLKELGYEVEGKTVNGLVRVNEDGSQKVLINIDSDKAINRIVGHETTHILEGTKEYDEFQAIVKQYATTKGEYDSRLKELKKLYKGTNANVENELTADLVGDYLFTDTDFINNLSTEKPSIFKKIFDEIKHLYKMATAGSKEARELEKVKRAFEKAYRKNATDINVATETSATQTGQTSIVDNKELYNYVKENKMLVSATDNLVEILESGKFDASKTSVGSYNKGTAISEYGQYRVHFKPEVLDNVDKMFKGDGATRTEYKKENTKTFDTVEEMVHNDPKTSTGQATYDEFTVKNDISTDMIDKVEIPTGTDQSIIDMLNEKGIAYEEYTAKPKSNTKEDSLLSMFGKKTQEPIKTETQSGELSPEQQEFFKDSVVRNEDGSLKVMYHGTSNGGHTVFDPYGGRPGLFGQGSYFTDNKTVAESYTEKGKGNNQQVYEVYLNITNPIDMDSQANIEEWKKHFAKHIPDAEFPNSGTNEDLYRFTLEELENTEYDRFEVAEIMIETFQKMGYDGITHIGGGRFKKSDGTKHRVYITFDSNQIKNVDNKKPTSDPDIRYSLSEELDSYLVSNNLTLDTNGNMDFETLTNKQINSLASIYRKTGYSDVSTEYLKSKLNTRNGLKVPREVADRFIEKELGYKPQIDTTQVYEDAEGNSLTKEQVEFYKDSDVRDIRGRLIPVYHRTDGEFTVFDKKAGTKHGKKYGQGFYFSITPENYGNNEMKVYLNAKEGEYKYVPSMGYYIVQEANQIKNVDNLNPTSDADIRYSLSESGLKSLAEKVGESYSSLESNLSYQDEYGIKRYLTKHTDIVKKYMEDNNISVEPVYKEMEFAQLKTDEQKQFVIDNDLDVMKVANNEKLLNQYMDLLKKQILDTKYFTEEETNGVIEMWRGYFELAKHDNEVPRVLKSIDREINAIKSGNTQVIDNVETDKKIQKEVIDSPEFQAYLDSLVKPLFDKPNYTAEEVMEEAIYNHGTTDDYETGAYMTLDGQLLDFNSGGYRDDHRTISAFGLDMNEFMDYGAIRMQPETPGFEMNIEPTSEQYSRLYDYIDYIKETRTFLNTSINDTISIDIDKGSTYDSATYDINTPTSKIIGDLKEYWRTGSFPKQSEFAQFRYSLSRADEQIAPVRGDIFGSDIRYQKAPVVEASDTEVTEDIAPIRSEAIRPRPTQGKQPRMARVKPGEVAGENVVVPTEPGDGKKQRRWIKTSTESDVVDGAITPDDLDQELIHYEVKTNAGSLSKANQKLDNLGYDDAVTYFNAQLNNKRTSVEDIVLGERLIQEALKKGDTKTAGELIQNVAILGTELGQKVQALSIIKRLTPEGQLKMLQKTINRGKVKEDVAFKDIELTQEQKDRILKVYKEDGSYDQNELNEVMEQIKYEIAKQMPTTKMEKVNAWRYLSMLGNPKTHIRNLVSNVAMRGTTAVKNAVARTIESVVPIKERTKTWKSSSKAVDMYAEKVTADMKDVISGDSKYSEEADIKAKRDTFKNKVLNSIYNFNSNLLEKEDWWFSRPAFKNSFKEYLTANGIQTDEDIQNNPKVIEKAKKYALEQSQEATFRQYSWLSNKIRDIEQKNVATQIAVGSVLPFKKTPINVAKTGLAYSPLGFTKTLTYDIYQVKKGNMEASTLVDNIAKNTVGTALTLVGYMLAKAGFLSGGGDDDKEGKYDSQLGEQGYSININGQSYSLSWLSPVAIPMFVGANAYEQLEEDKEWNGDVVMETLAKTLDPLSEMSFLSGLNDVLSSYDSGMQKFAGIGESMISNYASQFVPTILSQTASTLDDTKRSTKVSADSDWKFAEGLYNQIAYKIPGLRNTLEPATDIWGNEVKQNENILERALESFIVPYSRKEHIGTEIDQELKDLYAETGDNGILPSIPSNSVNYKNEKYKMSAEEYTEYKKTYGQTASDLLEDLFATNTYQSATAEDKADMVNKVYDYARDEAKREYLEKEGVEFTNATKDGVDYYKENSIKDAIANDITTDAQTYASKNPENYAIISQIGTYEEYTSYKDAIDDIKEQYKATDDMTSQQKTYLSKLRKSAVQEYIESLSLTVPQKLMLEKMAGGYSISDYESYMFGYIESLPLTAEEKREIHEQLFD